MSETCHDDAQAAARIPGCVFVRPGDSPRTVFATAPDGQLVHIGRAIHGQDDLACPECGARLVPRNKGQKRVPHYAHFRKGECSHAGETALHRIAKDIILEAGYIMLPPYEVDVGGRYAERVQPATVGRFDAVEVETWENGFRPDLIGTRHGADGAPIGQLIVEIRVTHAVDARKLEKLRHRGDSVVEIDLSSIDRNLDGEALARQILEEAPRSWLFHRHEEQLAAKAFRKKANEDARVERRKAFAIAKAGEAQKDRQKARETPARLDPPEMAWAAIERRRWAVMNMEDLFDRPADDGVFDVPPVLWRAEALQLIAPWCEAPQDLGYPVDPEKIATCLASRLQQRGWVKPTFGEPYKLWDQTRYKEVDAVREAVHAFLFDAVVSYGFTERYDYKRPDLQRARSSLDNAWQSYTAWRASLLALKYALERFEVELRLGPDTPKTPDCIDRLCASLLDSRHFDSLVPDFLAELKDGPSQWRGPIRAESLSGRGIFLRLAKDEESTTEDVLSHLARRRFEAQRKILVEWARDEAQRVAGAFEALVRDMPALGSELAWRQMGELRDADLLQGRIMREPDTEMRDPVGEGKKAITALANREIGLAETLGRLFELARDLPSAKIAELVRREGVSIGLDHHIDRERRHLRGLADDAGLDFTRDTLLKLIEIEDRKLNWGNLAERALLSKPPGIKARLLDLILGGFRVPVRREVGEIARRGIIPGWIEPSPQDVKPST